MKTYTIKKLLQIACITGLGFSAANIHANEDLNVFSNGDTADANDVNYNFTLLESRINNIKQVADKISWADYDSSAFSKKVFDVTGTNARWDKEIQEFDQAASSNTGSIVMTRTRTINDPGSDTDVMVKRHVITFNYDKSGAISMSKQSLYDITGAVPVLAVTYEIDSAISVLTSAMSIGGRWGTASKVTATDSLGEVSNSFSVDGRSLLAVENVTAGGVEYASCLKIENIRSGEKLGGHFHAISWYCPNNIGLVKSIRVRMRANMDSRVRELNAGLSVKRP